MQKEGNGIYIFIIEGEVELEGHRLTKRDGFGIWEVDEIEVLAQTNARILLMEVPMQMS